MKKKFNISILSKVHWLYVLMSGFILLASYLMVQYTGDISPAKVVDNAALQVEIYAPILAIIIGSMFGFFFYQQSLKKIDKNSQLEVKVDSYSKAHMKRLNGIFAAMALCVACYLLTRRHNLFLYASIAGVLMVFVRPLKSRIIKELSLSDEEEKLLLNE